ncbi:MAG: hypothetical protein ABF289_11630 [Clostridiales bacterium]
MIGDKYFMSLYNFNDENFAINELLNKLTELSDDFVNYINKTKITPENLNESEKIFLTKLTCLIEYFFRKDNLPIPSWVQDDSFTLKKPFVFGARKKDIWYLKTILNAPTVFKSRNVYFDLNSLVRV